jgi:uncharacterized membrane protein YgcG
MMAAIAAAGVVGALLAGCGGDDEAPIEPVGDATTDATEATSALSKREFIASADARCAEANVAIANLDAGSAAENLALIATQEQQITGGVLKGLEELGAPDDPTGALDRYLAALEEQVSILRQRRNAAGSGDTARYEQLSGELDQAQADARQAATEYGFKDCGQEGSALEQTAPEADSGGGTTVAPAPAPAPAPVPAPGTGGTGAGGTGGGGGTGGTGPGGSGGSGGVGPG